MAETATDWVAAIAEGADLRLMAMGAGGTVLATGRAAPEALRRSVAELTGALPPVVACGLGQAGLRKVPCRPLDDTLVQRPVHGVQLAAIPGLAQESPAHVMQGPETAIAGFLALNPKFDGVLCLPGETTVWAHISAEEVVSFVSFLTVPLARTTARLLGLDGGWDAAAFSDALSDMMAKPERLAERLASLRAEAQLRGPPEGTARARLWGGFLGAELAAARPYWLGQQVAVIGTGDIAQHYAAAIAAQGLPPAEADGAAMRLHGLGQARLLLKP
ncbi:MULTISPECIES: 2-dehydro-3-deoxygalactonokinase [Actibacterium]|uniref:2-dehydro-3-deoxygalactonokinase n=1 Tax=Actibacterium naphthalenivorans TaxID=1614693 RepID=A0A840CN74_9RHOB|nr:MULTISPECIES: 2-dehydro-3-deoxygalactonokinase [Actibacterium]ALG91992.1 hypothetical protein TQ29_13610 [Actibacterium sp. EMB200-NS6]MBB4023417.1 2-dehydro-3-deoxygalactonokinase [Actibacterium naphthalenivorans]